MRTRHEEARRLVLENGEWSGELLQITKAGKKIFVNSRRTLLRDEHGQPKSILIINTDITARKQAGMALAESEERFRQLAEHSSDVFWFVGLNPERVLYISPAVEEIWGLKAERFYEDSRAGMALIHPDDQQRVLHSWDACLKGQTVRFETEFRVVRLDGSMRWVSDSGTPIRNATGEIIRIAGMVKDITERKNTERQILRTQRLESIGALASGVAHDLNNALAPILMGIEILRLQYPDQTSLIDAMESSAKRGGAMVQQLLTFAKGAEGIRLRLQPLRLLKEMQGIVKATFPKNIELRAVFDKNLRTILGDVTQLHQVLLNLCVNARDAMPNGGILTLQAENAEIDATFATNFPGAKPGPYVVCRIKDTGTGIPPQVLDRIFEPFFTTKGPDKGTGLGLATVLGIVKGHGGFLHVDSLPQQGTTFTVYLPVSDSSPAETALSHQTQPAFRGNGETILVVDDEESILEITRTVLTESNFRVHTAADGTRALMKVADHRNEISVVITDLRIPHMDGLSLLRALKHMVPKAGLIVASGQWDEREASELKSLGVAALLDKPFTQETLVGALEKLLQTKPPPSPSPSKPS